MKNKTKLVVFEKQLFYVTPVKIKTTIYHADICNCYDCRLGLSLKEKVESKHDR